MLIAPPTIGSIGTAQIPNQNIGELKGTRDWRWNCCFGKTKVSCFIPSVETLPFIRNEVTQLARVVILVGPLTPIRSLQSGIGPLLFFGPYEGFPIASFYGWRADGIFYQTTDNPVNTTIPQYCPNDPRRNDGLIQPGDVRFIDLNGDGLTDEQDGKSSEIHIPRWCSGLNAELGYGNFDLSLFFLGNAGF